jgi:PadR family transcriptional regulator, regulatory protein PadR
MDEVRPTLAVVKILTIFLADVSEPRYGYGLMRATGYSSGKVYQIVARLVSAGWLDRLDNPDATPESGGPPRITYRLRPAAVPMARRMVTDAQKDVAAATAPRRTRRRIAAGGWA